MTAEQADAVARWQVTLTGIAIVVMMHLALVMNVMSAVGAGPSLARPNFPRHSDFLPPGVEFALLPFGGDALTHFLYLERPEGMERVDAAEFVPAAPPPDPVAGPEVMPRVQGFLTAGDLYRGIERGLSDLAARLGEPVLAVAKCRLGAAVRTGDGTVPAVRGMRSAGRGSRGGQLGGHGRRDDLGTARRAPAARSAARLGDVAVRGARSRPARRCVHRCRGPV